MKKLIFIMMIGSLFAQDELILRNGISHQGEYISSVGETIIFRTNTKKAGQSINISIIQKVVLEDGTEIYNRENEEQFKFDEITRILGGGLITFGSGLLLVTQDKECDNCDTLDDIEDFANKIKLQNQIGFGFIAIGGILIAMGE